MASSPYNEHSVVVLEGLEPVRKRPGMYIPGTDSGHRTYAQMTSEEKNKISHRRRAVEAMRNGLNLG